MKIRPALVLFALSVSALQTTAAQDDVIRVNTRLVEIDVVVRDKAGPVKNLSRDDFTVFDNGKLQRVEVFSVSAAERSKPVEDVPPLPAGVVSNRLGNEAAPSSATVILFDRLNSADRYQRDGRLQLISYLKTARREDLTAIYVLGDGVKLVQDFTNDVEQLVRAASKMEVGDLPGVENRTVREIAQSTSVGRVTRRDVRTAVAVADLSLEQRVDPTEEAVELISRHLSALPGRKSLIWMSAGIPLSITGGTSRDGRESQLRHATRLLTAANIAVYPVDTRGLRAPDPPRGRGRMEANLPPDAMIRLADETGGRAFYFNNDLESSIRTAISDAAESYTLGFYPSENGFDGKFHNLSVKVARDGADVRHRSGYFALKDQAPDEKERRAMMAELISSPLEAAQIGLMASAQAVSGNAKAFRVLLNIDVADLQFERRNERWSGMLDLVIHLESSKDKSVQIRTIPIDLAENDFRTALSRGLVMEDRITTEKPADRVRIVLQDRATGFAGTLWLPLGSALLGQ